MSSRPAFSVVAPRLPGDVSLPHNEELEKQTLQFITAYPDTAETFFTAGLCGDLYRRRDFRIVFDVVRALRDRGAKPDWFYVRAEFLQGQKDGRIAFDDPLTFEDFTIGVPPPRADNIPRMVADLRELAEQRKLISRLIAGESARLAAADYLSTSTAIAPGVAGLAEEALADAVDVAAEGQLIAAEGIQQLVEGLIPNYGMLGMLVAYAKVGKTTFGQALGAAVAMGRPFLGRETSTVRVLDVAAEDPAEYTAYTARHLDVDRGRMTFYRAPIILDAAGISRITTTARTGGYGFVLISSWQSVVRGLIRDENDNAGAVAVVEAVKAAARASGIPWLIDAHSGKGEDQDDDADPSKALRGASSAAGSADYMLSLRYANGAFGTQRRLSGKGRFVSFPTLTMEFDPATSTYTAIGNTKDTLSDTTWQLLCDTAAIASEGRTAGDIAECAGLMGRDGKVTNTQRRQVTAALRGRQDVGIEQVIRRGQKTTLYKLLPGGQA